jgi:NAD(P)-dependent dehydrogenase (short-subunit alcohol dehydrogenase family)
MDLKGNTAIVTGGGRGIGKAVALALAREGCNVVVSARTAAELQGVVRQIDAAGTGARGLAVPLDLAGDESASILMERTLDRFGSLGILVNNAGLLIPHRIPDISLQEWDTTMRINLRALLLLSQVALEVMKRAGRGCIVNVSSPAGIHVTSGLAAYGVSKAAVAALSQALYDEARRHGIKVSTLYPGYVDTGMLRGLDVAEVPPEQWALPEDMAECVVFLLRLGDRVIVRDLMPLAFKAEGR